MQMRFDGLLGFPGGLVNPSEETLEAGLGRELLEELGVALPISVEDHVDSCYAPASSPSSPSRLITHFYVKKMEEEQIKEVERAAASTATDHGQELVDSLLRLNLVTPEELHRALTHSLKIHSHTAEDLKASLALTDARRKRF
ncbi:U8 snoRNA-decapping enzyme [Nibea albiflora]|nr:U8 snoRNA-decapping enzyme [Nibea albiflora]